MWAKLCKSDKSFVHHGFVSLVLYSEDDGNYLQQNYIELSQSDDEFSYLAEEFRTRLRIPPWLLHQMQSSVATTTGLLALLLKQ